ncbi:hypothetical protein Aperf_G00000066597 [Anoplocephala perfoliata]
MEERQGNEVAVLYHTSVFSNSFQPISPGFPLIYQTSAIGVDRNVLLLPTYLAILGLFVVAVAIVGFIILVIILIIAQVVGGSLVLALTDQLASNTANTIKIRVGAIKSKTQTMPEISAFREFQFSMNCCGFNGPGDYGNYTDSTEQCCDPEIGCAEPPETGCGQMVIMAANKKKVLYGSMMIVFAVLQISSVVSAFAWSKWTKPSVLI